MRAESIDIFSLDFVLSSSQNRENIVTLAKIVELENRAPQTVKIVTPFYLTIRTNPLDHDQPSLTII